MVFNQKLMKSDADSTNKMMKHEKKNLCRKKSGHYLS